MGLHNYILHGLVGQCKLKTEYDTTATICFQETNYSWFPMGFNNKFIETEFDKMIVSVNVNRQN